MLLAACLTMVGNLHNHNVIDLDHGHSSAIYLVAIYLPGYGVVQSSVFCMTDGKEKYYSSFGFD